jgi:MtN3 and saliva related transmembrane protein
MVPFRDPKAFGALAVRADRLIPLYEAIGLVAGFLVALGLVPQVVKVWRLKDAQEISLSFNLLSLGGTVLWFVYGIVLSLVSVIVWNAINLVLLSALLLVKLKYGMEKHPIPPPSP